MKLTARLSVSDQLERQYWPWIHANLVDHLHELISEDQEDLTVLLPATARPNTEKRVIISGTGSALFTVNVQTESLFDTIGQTGQVKSSMITIMRGVSPSMSGDLSFESIPLIDLYYASGDCQPGVVFVSNTRRPEHPLVTRISALTMSNDAELEELEIAKKSKKEASAFISANLPHDANPKISLSDEGLVTLRWRRDDYGLLLVFAGDGLATYSIRPSGTQFSHQAKDISVQDRLPKEFLSALHCLKNS